MDVREIVPLSKDHDRSQFRCGAELIDTWCIKKCLNEHDNYRARVFVATNKGDLCVHGIYSLTIRSVGPKDYKKVGYPFSNVPAVYFDMLGVSKAIQKSGWGSALMLDAFARTLKISENVGVYCLWLTAIDRDTIPFYKKLGFSQIDRGKLDMYIPRETIERALGEIA